MRELFRYLALYPSNPQNRTTEPAQALVSGGGVPAEGREEGAVPGPWDQRLQSMLAEAPQALREVNPRAWEALGLNRSWVDPLFPSPPPLDALPLLGDRYQELEPIGVGATATVYRALDTLLRRRVALKVMRDVQSPSLDEARYQAKVEHPNVCRVYEVGQGYIVMQLVEGPTLAAVAPGLDLRRKVALVRGTALGVQAAHAKGLVHLDLKLENVLVLKDEQGTLIPMVSDFGMVLGADSHAPACPMGTPPYTSPEQLKGDLAGVDSRADVYALGVMLYVLISGMIPFDANDLPGLLEAMAEGRIVPLNGRNHAIPEDLVGIVQHCLEKRPDGRYPTAQALADELERFLTGRPVRIMGRSPGYLLGKWLARNRVVAGVGGFGFTAMALVAGLAIHHQNFLRAQAEWDHHFQGILLDMKTGLETAYRHPVHDLTPDLRKLEERKEIIKREMESQGKAARGPGHLALGQAELLLDRQSPRAADHFQAAWDLGFRTEATRCWLAFARLQDFNRVLPKAWAEQNVKGREARNFSLKERYILPARRMLEGRGGSDQARLAHLLDLAELYLPGNQSSFPSLQLKQEYRAKNPDNLQAAIDEANELMGCALEARGWANADACSPSQLRNGRTFRGSAMALLKEIQRLAPSFPDAYNLMARLYLDEIIWPVEGSPSPELALSEARRQLQAEAQVSKTFSGPSWVLPQVLGVYVTEQRLCRGLDPAPVWAEFQALGAEGRRKSDGRLLQVALDGSLFYLQTLMAYGRVPHDGQLQAIQEFCLSERTAVHWEGLKNWLVSYCVREGAQLFLACGRDPEILIRRGRELLAQEREPFYSGLPFMVHLAEASRAVAFGADPAKPLEACRTLLSTPSASEAVSIPLSLEQRMWTLAAKTGDEASLVALEASLSREEQPGKSGAVFTLDRLDAMLTLATRRTDTIRVQTLRGALLTALNQGRLPAHALHERLARVCLLEARGAAHPEAILRAGLREAELALVYLQPHPDQPWRPNRAERIPIHKAETWLVRGELLLALGEHARMPVERVRLGRDAAHALRQAVALNTLIQPFAGPLQARAERLRQ